ncbi:hypothetical protein BH10BDE1_BH10BDE1_11850 [soil metagenome]
MDVTSSFKTQIGDDGSGNKPKKMLALVGVLVVGLSITAWFFIQPLIAAEQPIVVAPVTKNPAKTAATTIENQPAVQAATDAASELSKSDAAAAAAAAAVDSSAAAAPVSGAAPEVSPEVSPAENAMIPAPEVPAPVANVPTTVNPPLAVPAPQITPTKTFAQPAPLTTAPSLHVADETPADEIIPVATEVKEVVIDRWEQLHQDNPGTVLPSNDMWVFQTRKLKSKVYVVKHAESLKAISSKLLYSDRFWVKLWSLNPTVTDPEVVPVGTEIVIDPAARATASEPAK